MTTVTLKTSVSLDGRPVADLIGFNLNNDLSDYFETLLIKATGKISDFETLVSRLVIQKNMPMKKFGHTECMLINLVAPHQARLLHDKHVGIMIDLPQYTVELPQSRP